MSNTQKKEQTPQERYFSARGAWMFFVLATAINLLLEMAGAGWRFPFLSEIVQVVAESGDGWVYDAVGLLITVGYALLWYYSEKKYALMTVCTVIYLIDSVLALVFMLSGSMETMILLSTAIRLLLAWAMIMGVKAAALLKKAEEQPMVILQEEENE